MVLCLVIYLFAVSALQSKIVRISLAVQQIYSEMYYAAICSLIDKAINLWFVVLLESV